MGIESPDHSEGQGFTHIEFTDPRDQELVDGALDEYLDYPDDDNPELDFNDDYQDDTEGQWPHVTADLGYLPYDPAKELRHVRDFEPGQEPATKEERRAIIHERLEHLRTFLAERQTAMAHSLIGIYDRIEAHPDEPFTDLIDSAAKTLRLSQYDYDRLREGEQAFLSQRALNKTLYEAYNGNSADIYHHLFNRPPLGAVNIVLDPASLNVQCTDLEDYIYAYHYADHLGDVSKITAAQRDHAGHSGGMATRVHPDPDDPRSVYTVTFENASKYSSTESVTEVETVSRHLQDDEFHGSFNIGPIHSLDITSGPHTWNINVMENGATISVIKRDDSGGHLTLTRQTGPDGRFRGYARSDAPDAFPESTYQEYLDHVPGRGYQSVLVIDDLGINYYDRRPEGADLTATQDTYRTKITVADSRAARETRRHEVQHILNSYFQPIEHTSGLFDLRIAALRSSDDAAVTKQRLLLDEARHFRRDHADPYARDEILAYYRGGRSLPKIFHSLTESSLYDYQHNPAALEAAKDWKERVTDKWTRDLRIVSTQGFEPLMPTVPELQGALDHVFGPEYKTRVQTWLDVISELEASGHMRDEILGLLYQEPASHWVQAASFVQPDIRTKIRARQEARRGK